MTISDIEIGTIVNFLNQGGYVLDFSTADFNTFTFQSIGIPLCQKYGLSKGRSLVAYIKETDYVNKIRLLSDLVRHYELSSMKEHDEEYDKEHAITYTKCRAILNRALEHVDVIEVVENLKSEFSSEYISAQIDLMLKVKDENPTEAIGKAKELIESCCKTILGKEGIEVDRKWDVIRLVDETFKFFNIMPKNIQDDIKGSTTIKAILGNVKAIAHGMAELRNTYGSGHGKDCDFVGLEPRHANLAIGSSTTLVRFLWDSYLRNHKNDVDEL